MSDQPYNPGYCLVNEKDDHKFRNIQSRSQNKRLKSTDTSGKGQENIRYLDTPLNHNLVTYIKNIVPNEHFNDIHKTIEEIAENEVGDSLFNNLVESLQSYFADEEESKKIAGQILFYKSRPCKMGHNCENIQNCVFTHDINREVIVNHVPQALSDKLEEYCIKYGQITHIKALHSHKFLIIFEEDTSALEFIRDRNPVLNDNSIKKFFNKKRVNLNNILNEHELLIQNIFDHGNKKTALKLRENLKKLKEMIHEQ
ncbi:hypothetical protein M153_13040001955 [Pseudoloma neurophilia]|uniref:Uncharacterized protein n=1 Tax=Pseudoloma neurophilia TaxID=146866 RepID=A0A0R0M1E3_9MICR|nr:hypothetical protein M153_13040001955 [Pseudoloma neurophilia]